MQSNNVKSPQFPRLRTETATANYFNFYLELNASFYVMRKLRCGTVWDGKHMQPFLKFYLKTEMYFLIQVFPSVAVLTGRWGNGVRGGGEGRDRFLLFRGMEGRWVVANRVERGNCKLTAIYLQGLARDRSLNTTGVPHFHLFISKQQSSMKIQIVAMLKHTPMHEWSKGQSLSNWFHSILS